MNNNIKKSKIIIWGVIVYLINAIISNFLWQNSLVAGYYQKYEGYHSMKSMDLFGGMGNWIGLNLLFGIFFTAFLIMVFVIIYPQLPGKTGWVKGMSFGFFIIFIKIIPEAFNQFMLFDYPVILILIQCIVSAIGILLFGIILSILFTVKVFR
ncbi:MAG: hypothetical protein MJB14_13450 [Spirochaetes bacterium]|nr:hypothetical protein [Spirochaetota bacterium]